MKEIVNHFVQIHNYSKIAFICGSEGNPEAEIRLNAYKKVLSENNIDFNPKLVVPGDFDRFSGVEAVKTLLDKRKADFDAIIAANDYMAIYAMKTLQEYGYKIPDDIAVGGFDDIKENLSIKPSMTTVRQPFYEMSKKSLETIKKLIEGKKVNKTIKIPAKLILRHSCGCNLNNTENEKLNMDKSSLTIKTDKLDIKSLQKLLKNKFPEIEERTNLKKWAVNITEILIDNITNDNQNNFINYIEDFSSCILNNGLESLLIYSIISFIFNFLKSSALYPDTIINNIHNKTLKKIGLIIEQHLISIKVEEDEYNYIIFRLNKELIGTFNLTQLKKLIINEFPKTGIKSCYLVKYIDKNRKKSSLLVHYNLNNDLKVSNIEFKSDNLIPDSFRKYKRNYNFIILPILFKEENIGYIIFELCEIKGTLYETLANQISGVIKGANLISEIQDHSNILEKTVKKRTKKLEEAKLEIEENNMRLKELDSLKNDFIANITHNFRSPLTAILNISDLALKDDINDIDKENYELIYKASLKLQSSIDKLLDLAKMDTRGIKLKITKINPVIILNRIYDFYSSSIFSNNKKIKIINSGLTKIEDFYSDFEKIDEILHNIMSNAIKFADQKSGLITLELIDNPKDIIFIISDNGIGIPKEKLNIIFNRFEQVDGEKNTRFKGSGIGLAYAKQLTSFLKGSIWAESKGLGKGSKFYLKLKKGKKIFNKKDFYHNPIHFKNEKRIKELIKIKFEDLDQQEEFKTHFQILNKKNEFDYKKGIILIVEDDKYVRMIIMKYLLKEGYTNFITVSNGKLALDAVFEIKPDIIICDYNMPRMRGDAFHDKIINHHNLKNIPFIFLSAISDVNLINERRQKGAYAYLKKPIDSTDLIFTINQHLKQYFQFLKTSHLANIDELSGLNNKKTIINILNNELSIIKNNNLSVVFIDIDNFKEINDKYGHQAGDKLIKEIGILIRENLREYDKAGRYGGDEFVIILKGVNLKNAINIAEKIRSKIERMKIIHNKNTINCTSSFGISSLIDNKNYILKKLKNDNPQNLSLKDEINKYNTEEYELIKKKISSILLEIADESLYNAKKEKCPKCGYINKKKQSLNKCPKCNNSQLLKGRNRVEHFLPNQSLL